MNNLYRIFLPVFAAAFIAGVSSCAKKSDDPSAIIVNSKDVTAANGSITTVGGATGTNGSSGSNAGTTTSTGSGSTTGNTGTSGSSGGGSSSGSSGNTGTTSSNNGNGGVDIGATNTIIVRVDGKDYSLSTPAYFLSFGYTTRSGPGNTEVAVTAFNLGSTDSFTLVISSNELGVQDITSANFYNGSSIYGWLIPNSSGKTNITQFNYVSLNRGTMKGTFDMYLKLDGGDLKRVVGSYNISM